jgi:outer membrane receptor protein involved in Fe transport
MKALSINDVTGPCGRTFRILLFLGCCLIPLFGQVTGTLRVLVTDKSDALVVGGTVRAVNVDTNETFNGTTNSSGYVVFTPIPRGTYNLDISSSGFSSVKVDAVTLDTGQNRQVPVQLQVANVASTVEVSAAAVALQTENASLGALVTEENVTDLPLQQRRYTDLALLTPGAIAPANNGSGQVNPTDVLVNGGRIRGNNFQLDGADNNGLARVGVLGSNVIVPPPDALTEFKVQSSNFSAEFGGAIGAVINVSLKSGTNQIHGSAWEFNRDTTFAANSWSNNLVGTPIGPVKWNQPGGTFGGPLKKNEIFYFGDFEAFHQISSTNPLATVPTVAMRSGDFGSLTTKLVDAGGAPIAGNKIPASQITALGQKILNLYPAPTNNNVGSGGRPANNYTTTTQTNLTLYKTDFRMDYNRTIKDHFFGRYSINHQHSLAQAVLGAATGNTVNTTRSQQGTAGWTRTISAAAVNEARWTYSNQDYDNSNTNVGQNVASAFGFLGIPAISDINLPSISVTNYNSLGGGGYNPQFHHPWSTAANDSLSLVKGKHLIKFGGNWTMKQDNFEDFLYRSTGFGFQGRFSGDAAADVLLGLPQTVSAEGFTQVHERQQLYGLYVQDQWKINPRLSVDIGLRYEYFTPFYGIGNFTNVNFNYAKDQLEVAPGGKVPLAFGAVTAPNRYAMNPDYNNFAPRLGVAYQISGRLVFRAAFGVFYDSQEVHGTTPDSIINAPNVYAVTLQRVGSGPPPITLLQAFPPNILDPSTVNSSNLPLNVFPQDAQASREEQWNATFQYQLTSRSTFQLGYVGNKATGLDLIINADNAPWGLDGTVPANRPYPQWASMLAIVRGNYGWSKYDALQANYDRRGKNWSTLTSFTWASAIGTTDSTTSNGDLTQTVLASPNGPVPIPDPAFANAFPHLRFTNGMTLRSPVGRGEKYLSHMNRVEDAFIGGWQASYIWSAQTGLPVNVSMGTTGIDPNTGKAYTFFNSEGGGALRPNRVGNPNSGISPSVNRLDYLNVASFQLQSLNTPGNAARNSAWGPGLVNVDLTLSKVFSLTERQRVEVRFEGFNAFNHTNYSAPNAVWGGTTFGQITSAGPNRVVQMGIKYFF